MWSITLTLTWEGFISKTNQRRLQLFFGVLDEGNSIPNIPNNHLNAEPEDKPCEEKFEEHSSGRGNSKVEVNFDLRRVCLQN